MPRPRSPRGQRSRSSDRPRNPVSFGLRCTESSWPSASPFLRSEEHTSELQSHSDLVCRLLLEKKKLRAFEPAPAGLQPSITVDEFAECETAIKRAPEFLDAMRRRGVTDPELVMVDAWSAGTYGDERPEERGKRLVRALAFVRSEPGDNGYARPLDGVIAVLDLHTMKVLRIDDHGVVPLPPEAGNWAGRY